MNWSRKTYRVLLVIATLALLILITLLYVCKFPFLSILDNQLFWTVLGILLATTISIYTHCSILKRNRQVATIDYLSNIRVKYPNMISAETAKCNIDKLEELRTSYLKEMEFFSLGLFEGIFDIETVARMSGHLLVKQYNDYMCDVVANNKSHEWAYNNYVRFVHELQKYVELSNSN